MLELLEMIFGTADALDEILNQDKNKSKGKSNIPLWIRIVFFILIYGSALLCGVGGGFVAFKESHIVTAIAYWIFALSLVVLLVIMICKVIKSFKAKRN